MKKHTYKCLMSGPLRLAFFRAILSAALLIVRIRMRRRTLVLSSVLILRRGRRLVPRRRRRRMSALIVGTSTFALVVRAVVSILVAIAVMPILVATAVVLVFVAGTRVFAGGGVVFTRTLMATAVPFIFPFVFGRGMMLFVFVQRLIVAFAVFNAFPVFLLGFTLQIRPVFTGFLSGAWKRISVRIYIYIYRQLLKNYSQYFTARTPTSILAISS